MTWRWASALVGVALTTFPPILVAQKGVEGGVHALGTFADFDFTGGGLNLGLRPGGRTRFAVNATPGMAEDELAFRGEGTAHFLLNPSSLKHGFYAGGGIAGITGAVDEGYLVLVIGVESKPGGGAGWVLETGIGGGVRVLLGYRWRKLRR
jgi:hypothetical protein